MSIITFQGFGGVQLEADALGSPENPSILLLHGGCQTRKVWKNTAEALEKAGRYVVSLDLRGHGQSDRPEDKRYDFLSFVEDLKAVLAQMDSRPVIIAGPLGSWIASGALGGANAPLSSGLIMVDSPINIDPETVNKGRENFILASQSSSCKDWDPAFVEKFDSEAGLGAINKESAKLKIPTLYIRGQNSEFTSQQPVEEFVNLLEQGELVEIENVGHLVVEEQVDTFNAVVLDFLERKAPRVQPGYVTGSDSRLLRDAMGCFATGVAVVTAKNDDGTPLGLTVNSFTSVSLDPALVLVCIANTAGSAKVMENVKHFAINILHIGQQPTSNLFARPGEDRFANTPWTEGDNKAPILSNSLASIECSHHAVYDGGDHFILVGHVDRVSFDSRRDPLLYFNGKYRRLHFD